MNIPDELAEELNVLRAVWASTDESLADLIIQLDGRDHHGQARDNIRGTVSVRVCQSATGTAHTAEISADLIFVLPHTYPSQAQLEVALGDSRTIGLSHGHKSTLLALLRRKLETEVILGEVSMHTLATAALDFLSATVIAAAVETKPRPLADINVPKLTPIHSLKYGLQLLTSGMRDQLKQASVRDLIEAAIDHASKKAAQAGFAIVHSQPIVRPKLLEQFTACHERFISKIPDSKAVHETLAEARKPKPAPTPAPAPNKSKSGKQQPKQKPKLIQPTTQQIQSADLRVYAPVFAFHSTYSKDLIPSITEAGLLAPGSILPDGNILGTAHGRIWGPGVYVSPDMLRSSYYGVEDDNDFKQTLVTLVTPGRVRFLEDKNLLNVPSPILTDHNCHVSPDMKEYVLHEGCQVLPLVLLTYGRATNKTGSNVVGSKISYKQDWLAKESNRNFATEPEKAQPDWQKEQKEKSKKQNGDTEIKEPTLIFERLKSSPSHYALHLNRPLLNSLLADIKDNLTHAPSIIYNRPIVNLPRAEVRLTLMLDRSKSMGKAFRHILLPSCSLLVRTMAPSRTDVVFFGTTVSVVSNVSEGYFESNNVKEMPLEDGTNILGAYKAAVEACLRDTEAFGRQVEDDALQHVKEQMDKKQEPDAVKSGRPSSTTHAEIIEEVDAADQERKRMKAITKETHRALAGNRREIIPVFVLLTDGKDTENSEEDFDKAFVDAKKRIFGAGLATVFRCIGIGRKVDMKVLTAAKMATETLSLNGQDPVAHCRKVFEIPAIIANEALALRRVTQNHNLCVEYLPDWWDRRPRISTFGGFIQDFTTLPVSRVHVPIPDDGDEVALLHVGAPPSLISAFGLVFKCKIVEPQDNQSVALLRLLRKYVVDVKVAAVAGHPDVAEKVNELKRLVSAIKDSLVDKEKLQSLTPVERINMMKNLKGVATDLEAMLNELSVDVRASASSMTSEEAANWLRSLKAIKFSKNILKRVGDVAELADFDKDIESIRKSLASENAITFAGVPLRSKQSQLTSRDLLTQTVSLNLQNLRPSDVLYASGMVGYGIELFRSEASTISPWQIICKYVSTDIVDSATSMCYLHAKCDWSDSRGRKVQDVLILCNPQDPFPEFFFDTSIYKMYLSVVFTRNPDLHIGEQELALLAVSLVQAIEQLYKQPQQPDGALIDTIFNILYTLQRRHAQRGWYTHILKKLLVEDPGVHMTEAEGDQIDSISKILVSLCIGALAVNQSEARNVLGKFWLQSTTATSGTANQAVKVGLAILGESVSRGVRIMLKTKQVGAADGVSGRHGYRGYLRQALGLDGLKSGVFSLVAGKKYSGEFFKDERWRTNASPRTVVSTLSFARFLFLYYHAQAFTVSIPQQILMDESKRVALKQALCEELAKDEGMSGYMKQHSTPLQELDLDTLRNHSADLPATFTPLSAAKDLLQTALYVQGLRYHDSKSRRVVLTPLTNPMKVIETVVSEERKFEEMDKLRLETKQFSQSHKAEKAAIARKLLLAEQEQFLQTHGQGAEAKLFTFAEIAEMNRTRPADDQLDLLSPSGLLKHHCCFPSCPEYLVNQATDADRVHGRRWGLFRHLQPLVCPEKSKEFMPSFHLVMNGLIMRYRESPRELAEEQVMAYFWEKYWPQVKDRVAWQLDDANVVEHVKNLWKQSAWLKTST